MGTVKTPKKRRPSLRDLAKQLGVSHTTINMALQDDERISQSLRQQIRKVAEQEGYFPNDLGWGLRTGRTGLVGIVLPMTNSAFISSMLDAAIDKFWGAGYFPITLRSALDLDTEERLLESLARRRVEGVVLMPSREDSGKKHFAALLREHVPLVALNNHIPKLNLPLVASDDTAGAILATRHLIENGHRRILHIGSHLDNRYGHYQREAGYRQAMKEAGLQPKILRFQGRLGPSPSDKTLQSELVRAIDKHKTTALFCFNDNVALVLYDFCRSAGLRIPEDISVVGYSNQGWQGSVHALDFVDPPLTTVDQHAHQIGDTAASTLIQMIKSNTPVPAESLIKPTLVRRASVKKV